MARTSLVDKNTITASQAHQLVLIAATERFQNAQTEQTRLQTEFTEKYGASDRIDAALLNEVQRLQMRFAAIAARQAAERNHYGTAKEPRAAKTVAKLGEIIGDLTVYIATEQVEPLFRPVREEDFLGDRHDREQRRVGRLGYDPRVLEGKTIIPDQKPAEGATGTEPIGDGGGGETQSAA